MKSLIDLDKLDFDKGGGLLPVVAQHARTGAVLMVAYANRQALEESLGTGEMHFFSRTRGLWHKGKTSGHILRVVQLVADCDNDTVLARVEPFGPTCHTGMQTCFGPPEMDAIRKLESVIHKRATSLPTSPQDVSYTRELLADRNLRLKKIGEESSELVVALADDDKQRIAEEAADLIFHVLVALQAAAVPFDEVRDVLNGRVK